MDTNWRDNAGNLLLDPNDPAGNPITTPLDRRWLWRLASALAVSATNDVLRDLGRDLHQYLGETCEHHWLHYAASEDPDDTGAFRQCLWCHDTRFGDDPGSHYVTFSGEDWVLEGPHRTACLHFELQRALRSLVGHGAPIAGRWRIASIHGDGGSPELERADDKHASVASSL